jgi:alkanesulfonate monooxygenase SsuD/methylene tetrahydromethanopterin reductase-like flavin-dependent oxidoreductase (luciferase family)
VPVEFIGIARTADRSETIAETGPAVEPEYLYHLAATHEQSGFDRVLVAHSSSSPDGFAVADQVLSVSLRPIAADTETAAWERAREILEVTTERAADFLGRRDTSQAEGSRRLLQFAAAGEVHDKRLWTALSRATRGRVAA